MVIILVVALALARLKQKIACDHFKYRACETPYIRRRIIVRADDHLWRAVLSRLDLWRKVVVGPTTVAHIADFDLHIFINLRPALLFFRVLRILWLLFFFLFSSFLRFCRFLIISLGCLGWVDCNGVDVNVDRLLVIFIGQAFVIIGGVAIGYVGLRSLELLALATLLLFSVTALFASKAM